MADFVPTFVGVSGFASPSPNAALDVIFLHGITGDRLSTWTYAGDSEAFWPKWIASDHSEVNVYCAGYDSSIVAGAFSGEGSSIIDIATSQLDMLTSCGLLAPRCIFVVHSLGGLVVKQVLRKCADSVNPKHKAFLSKVKGVVFIGTPHCGAGAAKALDAIVRSLLSKAVKQLAYGEESLLDLNEWFRTWAVDSKVVVAAYYETKKTKGLKIVDKISANPQVYGCHPIAIDADHLEICKPASTEAQLYKSVSAFISDLAPRSTQKAPIQQLQSGTDGQATSSDLDAVKDQLDPEVLSDYENFTTTSPDDRRSLAEKLNDSGRPHEVRTAQRKKEQFSMTLHRHAAQASSLEYYTRLMADIESRFNRHVLHAVANGVGNEQLNQIIQKDVIDSAVKFQGTIGKAVTATLVERALYYLAGNCHLRWDNVKD